MEELKYLFCYLKNINIQSELVVPKKLLFLRYSNYKFFPRFLRDKLFRKKKTKVGFEKNHFNYNN